MWLATIDGFYSIVQHRDDPTKRLVRCRHASDLHRFLERVDLHPHNHVDGTPDADYPFRATLDEAVVAMYLGRVNAAMDYDNFKMAVTEQQSARRAHTYVNVWQDLLALEDLDDHE